MGNRASSSESGLSMVRYTPMASMESWGQPVMRLIRLVPLASPLTMTLVTVIKSSEILHLPRENFVLYLHRRILTLLNRMFNELFQMTLDHAFSP